MRAAIVATFALLCAACNMVSVRETAHLALADSGISVHHTITRSTRWTLTRTVRILLYGDYDVSDATAAALLAAAYAGVARVFPQVQFDANGPGGAMAADGRASAPVDVVIRIGVPRQAGEHRFAVTLLDAPTGDPIDQSIVTLAPALLGDAITTADVTEAFASYAAQLLATQ